MAALHEQAHDLDQWSANRRAGNRGVQTGHRRAEGARGDAGAGGGAGW